VAAEQERQRQAAIAAEQAERERIPVLQPPATPSTSVSSIGLEPDVLTPPVQPPATGAAGAALPLLIAAAAAVLLN
jgi:hypothetical protein